MVAYFLVLTMIWHDASAPNGPDFVIRRAVAEISEGAPMCEAVRDELRAKWQKEAPGGTIIAECIPVIITTRV